MADLAEVQAISDAGEAMRGFLTEVIGWKRRQPADDLLSALIAAEDDGSVLSDDELLEQVMLLYIAGHETTVNLIGNGLLALLRDRVQLERLRSDPSSDANAIEELLRYDSPVQMTRRITVSDTEADQLDLARPTASQHLAFGGGAHYCLGAALARLEGRLAITGVIRRFANLELTAEPEWNGRINLRGLTRLPLAVAG